MRNIVGFKWRKWDYWSKDYETPLSWGWGEGDLNRVCEWILSKILSKNYLLFTFEFRQLYWWYCSLRQRSPIPGPQTVTVLRPVGTGLHNRRLETTALRDIYIYLLSFTLRLISRFSPLAGQEEWNSFHW